MSEAVARSASVAISLSNAMAAALFAVDPVGLGGVALRSGAGPARAQWLARLQALLPAGTPWRRVPLHTGDDRLLGGLDLAATLQAGRPVAQRGLLAEADGGVLLLAMAERLSAATGARVAAVMDAQELVTERDGIGSRRVSRIGVVALDEGIADDEQMPSRLRDRLAFHLVLGPTADADPAALFSRDDVIAARGRCAGVHLADPTIEGLCAAALALGIDSVRAPMLACRAARAAAALDGRNEVNAQDAALAAGLVLGPRATQRPATPLADDAASSGNESSEAPDVPDVPDVSDPPESNASPEDAAVNKPPADTADAARDLATGPIDEVVLEAALAAIPPGLLAAIALGPSRLRTQSAGRAGAAQTAKSRGRPVGARRGEPQGGSRLNLIETLRAAAPWQPLRRREREAAGPTGHARIQVRREDFHVTRFQQHSETTTLFVVDASGSSALNRLAEAKGAVELLLADCYVRRDSVAVIAFRGAVAELLLPPTRSLVRAKRSLAGLPGGGGTPLAAGIDAARALADSVRRRGATPIVVLLTDGRANIARDGSPGRARAAEDALSAARLLRLDGFSALLLDTSPQSQAASAQEPGRQLATAMGARYLPLPYAGAAVLSQAVQAATSPMPR